MQKLAFEDGEDALKAMMGLVLDAQRVSVKLPTIGKAVADCEITDEKGKPFFTVKKGKTVICDVPLPDKGSSMDDLAYRWSFTEKFAAYHPKQTAALSITAMITVLAQMQDLRRGHDSQGRLRTVTSTLPTRRIPITWHPCACKRLDSRCSGSWTRSGTSQAGGA